MVSYTRLNRLQAEYDEALKKSKHAYKCHGEGTRPFKECVRRAAKLLGERDKEAVRVDKQARREDKKYDKSVQAHNLFIARVQAVFYRPKSPTEASLHELQQEFARRPSLLAPSRTDRLTRFVEDVQSFNWHRLHKCPHKSCSRKQETCGTCEFWQQDHEIKRLPQQHAGGLWARCFGDPYASLSFCRQHSQWERCGSAGLPCASEQVS